LKPDFSITLDDLLILEADWHIGGITDPVGQTASWIVSQIEGALQGAMSTIGGIVSPIINGALSYVNGIIGSIPGQISSVLSSVQNIPGMISSSISGIASQIGSMISGISSTISGALSSVSSVVSSGFSSIIGSLSGMLSGIAGTISTSIGQIGSQISSGFSSLVGSISSTIGSISTAIGGIASTISGALNTAFSQIGSTIGQLGAAIGQVGQQIITGITGTLTQIGTALSGIGATLSTALNSAFQSLNTVLSPFTTQIANLWNWATNLKFPNFAPLISFLEAFGSDPLGAIKGAINDVLTNFGLPTIDQIEAKLKQYVPDLGPVLDFVNAFEKDPIGTIKNAINEALKAVGFPTLDQISALIPTYDGIKKAIFDDIDLTQIGKFVSSAFSFLSAGEAHHSPTGFDDFWNFFGYVAELFSSTGALGTFFESAAWKALVSGKPFPMILSQTAEQASNFFKPLTDYLTNIWTTIEADATALKDAVSKFLGVLVTDTIAAYKLPKPDPTITDPFAMIGSTVTQEFDEIAGSLITKNFVTDKQAAATIETILAVIGITEALEFGALAVEALHPTKKLQFMDKLKRSFSKIGLGQVTGVVGGALVGVSLSPFFKRYFNKIAQIQLVSPGELIEMEHRDLIAPKDLDTYLQEHGLNQQFRDGVTELGHPLIAYMTAAQAYFRAIAFDGFEPKTAIKELTKLMTFEGVSDSKRSGFTFADTDLLGKILYSLPSRFILRSLWMTGQINADDLAEIFTADGMMPDYVKQAANATVLQGLLPFIKAQASAFETMVQHGFETGATFTDLLKKIAYPTTFITPTVAAAQLKASEEINVLQVSEYDKQYTDGYMTKDDYKAKITGLIKNADILKAHLAIADLAVERATDNRIRAASDRAVSQELIAFADGAVSEEEFATVCKASNKTDEEIAALERARQVIYQGIVRAAKFKNYQNALGREVITPDQFVTACKKLPIDDAILQAAKQRILIAMLPKPKLTAAQDKDIITEAQAELTQ